MLSFETQDGPDSRRIITITQSDTINACVLAANVAKTQPIPTGAGYVMIGSTTGYIWMKFGTSSAVTASVPTADVIDGSASAIWSSITRIPPGTTHVSMACDVPAKVSLTYYGA